MAPGIDYNALKAQTLGSGAEEEAVTVNTRALIDKVLARYSGDWTVLRELLQNAADANATRVTVKIETLPSATVPLPTNPSKSDSLKHVVAHHTVKRMLITNNGHPFTENDWSRLKRIAEGNPDETKIGAFGVGFYSVFADCEEPFISSGNQAMAFYWKGNSLFTRRSQLEAQSSNTDTNFLLDYRSTTSPVPSLLQISQFLATSLSFVGIEDIELWLDEYKVLALNKKNAPETSLVIPRGIETRTRESMMRIVDVRRQVAQIDGSWMNIVDWKPPPSSVGRAEVSRNADPAPSLRTFFYKMRDATRTREELVPKVQKAPEADLTERSAMVIFLHVTTATIDTTVTRSFSQELERATKKPPPKKTKLSILTSPFLPTSATTANPTAGDGVFGTVLPTKSGRVFIGFPTHQTTGLRAHLSAPSVIPTVERESIDLNARWVRTWNGELLQAAGILCRISWTAEMKIIQDNIRHGVKTAGKSKVRSNDIVPYVADAVDAANTYSFHESTPSDGIRRIIEDGFWTCNTTASIELLSTCGVLPNHEIRIAPKNLSFMDELPTLPERMTTDAKPFVDRLIDFGLLTEVSAQDIGEALERSPLSTQQLHEFLTWLGTQWTTKKYDSNTIRGLLKVAVADIEPREKGQLHQILVLASINSYLNPSKIAVDLPMPPSVMPFIFTKDIPSPVKEAFGWSQLQLVPWVKWLVATRKNRPILTQDQDITESASFSGRVLAIVSKQWDVLRQEERDELVEVLSAHTIMPTKLGMRRPADAYFPSVKVFDDLPVVMGLQSVKERVLVALGVRKTLELSLIFSRLVSDAKKETEDPTPDGKRKALPKHMLMIQYLASVQEEIPQADLRRLKGTPICPKESLEDGRTFSEQRYTVSSLYEPTDDLRELGLPILAWTGIFRKASAEGRLLTKLGLKSAPGVEEMIDTMAKALVDGNDILLGKAMSYFITNHYKNGYSRFDYSQITKPFLPVQGSKEFSAPSKCFTDPGAALFGFNVIDSRLATHASKFGVQVHPPISACVDVLLQRPPKTKKDARSMFSYFSGRLNEINASNIPRLNAAKFIPLTDKKSLIDEKPYVVHVSPQQCFLGESEEFDKIFDFVDFGPDANSFLFKCGTKREPSKTEIAAILVNQPRRIYETFQDHEKYLELLRSLADSIKIFKKDKALFSAMKKASFLLATKYVPAPRKKVEAVGDDGWNDDEPDAVYEWQLTSAANTVLIDDFPSYRIFKSDLMAAPQEIGLEDFYAQLGAPRLSQMVEERKTYGSHLPNQKGAHKLYDKILERSKLFLHEQAQDSIRYDTRWLEANLQVIAVSSIRVRRKIRGTLLQDVEERSAATTLDRGKATLWISGNKNSYYEISQCLVHLLLQRPTLHHPLTLEMLLTTDLKDLGSRGFNVSRILRRKEAERRLVIEQQQLAEERQRNEAAESAAEAAAKTSRAVEKALKESGLAPPSSQTDNDLTALPTKPTLPFYNLRKQLGLNLDSESQPQTPPRPSLTDHNSSPPSLPGSFPTSQSPTGRPTPTVPGPQPPTNASPADTRRSLHQAIQSSRHASTAPVTSAASQTTVTEPLTYCDLKPGTDLIYVGTAPTSASSSTNSATSIRMKVFITRGSVRDPATFLPAHVQGLTLFATLLRDVAAIFPALDLGCVNIFAGPDDDADGTIAFNRGGSVFANYSVFRKLHLAALQRKGIKGSEGVDALLYWWITMCHELAHNLVSEHSARHSYYLEGFVTEFMGGLVQKMGEYQRA